MKKILVMIIAIAMICMLMPSVANAATATDGETFDLSTLAVDEKLIVPSGATVTLTGTAPQGVQVECGAGVNITLDNVDIYSPMNYQCALSFTGTGNTLNLVGVSRLRSGTFEPGVKVEDTTELIINGPGEINARGSGSAGIGGSYDHDGGTITINSGTIKAESSAMGAGIGGGNNGDGGTIIIKGGTVEAIGGDDAAGIGGGERGNGGTIIIEGGTITATTDNDADHGAAGIGGGYRGNGGTITIKNGTVIAEGYEYGAGIGAGPYGKSSTVKISGGHIVATGGVGFGSRHTDGSGTVNITGGEMYVSGDGGIGGIDITTGTLNISGESVVFLENEKEKSTVPSTTHIYSEYADETEVDSKYRSNIPGAWHYPIYSYIFVPKVPNPETGYFD